MANSVTISGINDLEAAFSTALSGEALQKGLGIAGAAVERAAKQKAAKDKGHLAQSIQYEVDGNTCRIFCPVEYAPYVEYGTGLFAENGDGRKKVPWRYKDESGDWHSTKGQKPHPFMRPALNEQAENVANILGGSIFDG